MTDTSKRELIEEAAKAGWDAWNGRGARVSGSRPPSWDLAIRAALAVFEQAHTPADDEREALRSALHQRVGVYYSREEHEAVLDVVFDLGFRRTAVQEPGEREAKIHGELVTMRVKEWRRITDELARLRTMEGQLEEPEPGKRLDPDFRADLVDAASHRITDAWADVPEGVDAETLAQNVVAAQEFLWIARGFPVAVQEPSGFPAYFAPKPPMTTNRFASEPQGEPTDAQVDAGCVAFHEHATGLTSWGGLTSWARLVEYDKVLANRYRDGMRRALRAAYETKGEGR